MLINPYFKTNSYATNLFVGLFTCFVMNIENTCLKLIDNFACPVSLIYFCMLQEMSKI